MKYLHHEFDVGPSDVIEVALDHPANVLLLDTTNYDNYRNGRQYRYRGGYAKASPVRISPPRAGHWHLVVDLGGGFGTVRASASLLSQTA